ncbi:MAG: hypothetical protein Q8M98_04370 [Candidatus Cloacimonadaceae bacterium]|nr:hypothetical protein [Candidatus Cloacimonadaceae bacterium]MDP3113994.1 hypothetical protein [Candidatus Cloacimonadaceae bacterium]
MKPAGLFVLIMAILLSACATGRFSAGRDISSIAEIMTQDSPGNNDKALYEPRTGTLFVLQRETHEIHIYRENIRINSIGGLGFERINFQRLSDIALDSEGSLLVLDTMHRRIKKFTPEGKYISEIALSETQQPEYFCPGGEQNIFVYDAAMQEIICYSLFDASVLYRFGKFQLSRVSALSCGRDYIVAYCVSENDSQVFFTLGQFKQSQSGQLVYDSFNNPLSMEKLKDTATYSSLLRISETQTPIPLMQSSGAMSLYREYLSIPFEGYVKVYQLRYERNIQ